MGYLHEGHLSLVKIARKKADIVFVSIFVNPLQFGPGEDYEKYPRDIKRDEKLCREAGVDYILYPKEKDMYPEDYSTFAEVEKMTDILEGRIRPGHFKGVTTVVLKLFNIVQPHIAVFGQKDAQQAAVIRKMVNELNLDLKIVIGKTIREPDGLAMSSRNVYLNKEERKNAPILYRSLCFAKEQIERNTGDINYIRDEMTGMIRSCLYVTNIDYISFNEYGTLKNIDSLKNLSKNSKIIVSLAVRIGKVRLIDNIVIKY
jgi:pantoate--beta-alanine ligase